MAPRGRPTPFDADNSSGSYTPAACIDWRFGVADSMSARVSTNPHQMPDIRLQASPQRPPQSISFFPCGGSPYTMVTCIQKTQQHCFAQPCNCTAFDCDREGARTP